MTGAPLTVSYNAVGGATENSGFFEIQQNGDFNYISSSMTYARGTAAASLGLAAPPSGVVDSTPGLYAFDSTPGLIVTPRFAHACPTERFTKSCTSVASFMDNLVQTENDQWSSFQDVYNPTSATPPGERATLEAWDQSSAEIIPFWKTRPRRRRRSWIRWLPAMRGFSRQRRSRQRGRWWFSVSRVWAWRDIGQRRSKNPPRRRVLLHDPPSLASRPAVDTPSSPRSSASERPLARQPPLGMLRPSGLGFSRGSAARHERIDERFSARWGAGGRRGGSYGE
jgi:hypothetical protein